MQQYIINVIYTVCIYILYKYYTCCNLFVTSFTLNVSFKFNILGFGFKQSNSPHTKSRKRAKIDIYNIFNIFNFSFCHKAKDRGLWSSMCFHSNCSRY